MFLKAAPGVLRSTSLCDWPVDNFSCEMEALGEGQLEITDWGVEESESDAKGKPFYGGFLGWPSKAVFPFYV